MQEIWRPVPLKGLRKLYEVSDGGLLRSLKQGKVFVCSPRIYNGYRKVLLKIGSQVVKTTSLHRLVALAFIPNPKKKECVNHINNNTLDNRVSNLEWVSQKENRKHTVTQGRHARGESVGSAILNKEQVLEIRKKDHLSTRILAKMYNTSPSNINSIIRRKSWKHI